MFTLIAYNATMPFNCLKSISTYLFRYLIRDSLFQRVNSTLHVGDSELIAFSHLFHICLSDFLFVNKNLYSLKK